MTYVVLVAWLVQASAGVLLLTRWWRHRIRAGVVVTHVALSVLGLALWVAYVLSDHVFWGWGALGLIAVGNGFGDAMLLRRARAMGGRHLSVLHAYRVALGAIFAGRMPAFVIFHALLAGVVFFATLAVCVVATV
ncbi:hypothetical protein FB381_0549 [Nocardioides albertanoniae]|uniref:Uncharacterized protein n=1 Tax=Nocardioides albertanoniae TaxID=1175486 RepID=A0A543A266_9ACTN|nr:hypothetical protein [Nocardioides albertanoniae]TQL66685.1 hypothetical protein FB381_0549 [Nocardioides albertanoniae]